MRPVLILSALLFLTNGCDVFVPDVGGDGQECSSAGTCKDGLTCRNGTCCRTHWEGPGCSDCPGNWDAEQDCNACTGNWDPAQDCAECLGNWDKNQGCNACLSHWQDNDDDCGTCEGNWDIAQNCDGCLGNWDPDQDCETCLNHWEDSSDDCGTCPGNWDAAQDCDDCLGNWNPAQNCTVCQNQWVDNSDDCGTCPGNWDAQQDCAECVGNWDPAQDCTVCRGNWVDAGDDCGTCAGNWDPDADCAVCLNHWVDNSDDCGTCPPNWDGDQECNACLTGWFGEWCEKVTDCTGQPDFTLCEVDTSPNDYYYDICVQGTCTSPGCDQQYCNAPGPHFILADTNVRVCFNNTGTVAGCPGDAGQVGCITVPFCGQDAQYGWDAAYPETSRFNRHEEVTDQPIVVDLVTGLVWQGCSDNRSGTDCQAGMPEGRSWRLSLEYCDGLDWGGFTDWHLPDEYELLSIVDYDATTTGRAIDPDAFPETSPEHFWTSSTAHGDQAYAVALEFGAGSMEASHKNGEYHFLCVRNGPQVAGGAVGERFTVDNTTVPGEPMVTDNVTGLEWQGCLDGRSGSGCSGTTATYNWMEALTRCEELQWGNHDDWYLPNIKQLQSITDNRGGNPAIDTSIFPVPPDDVCWSSTTIIGEMQKAWVVKFSERGLVFGGDFNMKGDTRAVRCVRDGL